MATPDETVQSLAERARDGDRAALEELLALCRPTVLRVCARFLPHHQDAEDACQETLLAVAAGIAGWDGRAAFSTWLYRVAANRSRSTYQVLARRAAEHPASVAPERPDPRTTSVVAGTRLDLLDALAALGPVLGEAVALRDVAGLEYREIAAILGVAEGTVKSRIHDGRRQLRIRLAG